MTIVRLLQLLIAILAAIVQYCQAVGCG